MAQEQQYKHPNVCVPHTPPVRDCRTAVEGRPATAQRGSGSWHLPALAILHASLRSKQECTAIPPTHRDMIRVTGEVLRMLLGGKESEKEDRKERVSKEPHQARLGRVPRGMASTLHSPPSWALKAGRRALRCLQMNTAGREPRAQLLRACKLS